MKINTSSLAIIVLYLLPDWCAAQCAMCRAVLESSDNTAVAESLNDGIIYLIAVPYLLVGFLFYFIYRKFRN